MSKKKKISDSSTNTRQNMILIFLIPFLALLLHLMLTIEMTQEGLIFVLIICLFIIGINLWGLRFWDVYLKSGNRIFYFKSKLY